VWLEKESNTPPILAVATIVTLGQTDTFQLLLDELSVLALQPLWQFQGERTQLLVALVAKNLIYWENYHCVRKCRLSPELLNLEEARKNMIFLCLRLAQKKNKWPRVFSASDSYSMDLGIQQEEAH